MAMLWPYGPSDASGIREKDEGDTLKMIPMWSIVLATIAFIAIQYGFNRVPSSHHHPGSLFFQLFIGYSTGTALAGYILLVGYISRDVRRRNMSGGLWILIALMMPGGIGAVVYFLLRYPILKRCPSCTTEIPANIPFCTQCQFQMTPVCNRCYRGVEITDAYCGQCGHNLADDDMPSRLRAYSD
jgi:hypothetical protein